MEQSQPWNFSRTVKGKHQTLNRELWEQNKTKLIKLKEKSNKNSYIQLSKDIYIYIYIYIYIQHIYIFILP